ncbi:MAG: NAD(+)/NADH kinase, partial [Candidatus Odinarchaeota archaeon]|nr:NAD(+)/NADH kinase [Candidatus Odinarchaeota archaeon]
MTKKELKIGFVINPIAGMGGRVGLKGTDGVYEKALELGAEPVAPKRAREFLSRLYDVKDDIKITFVSAPKEMGETELKEFSFSFDIIPLQLGERTTAEDTKRAVKEFLAHNVDLIVFVGGDGTARDVMDAIGQDNSIPVLGVPSGVKMYSGVFAINPRVAADLII